MKTPAKTGFEQDAIGRFRRVCKYLQRAGARKKAKRQMSRRARHEWKINIKTIA